MMVWCGSGEIRTQGPAGLVLPAPIKQGTCPPAQPVPQVLHQEQELNSAHVLQESTGAEKSVSVVKQGLSAQRVLSAAPSVPWDPPLLKRSVPVLMERSGSGTVQVMGPVYRAPQEAIRTVRLERVFSVLRALLLSPVLLAALVLVVKCGVEHSVWTVKKEQQVMDSEQNAQLVR